MTIDQKENKTVDQIEEDWSGLGLSHFPLMYEAIGTNPENWFMSPAEKMVIMTLVGNLKPKLAIEIGTRDGGCLTVISRFAEKVYSIDIDPKVAQRLHDRFNNVEFLTGPSRDILPPLLTKLADEKQELGFVLVDGDHSAEGVRTDIDILLKYTPCVPLYIFMHDSMNPDCRSGMRAADWASNPYVHAVELDLVGGVITPVPRLYGQAWEGLALAIMKPVKRNGPLTITARGELMVQCALAQQRHARSIPRRALRKIKRLFKAS